MVYEVKLINKDYLDKEIPYAARSVLGISKPANMKQTTSFAGKSIWEQSYDRGFCWVFFMLVFCLFLYIAGC